MRRAPSRDGAFFFVRLMSPTGLLQCGDGRGLVQKALRFLHVQDLNQTTIKQRHALPLRGRFMMRSDNPPGARDLGRRWRESRIRTGNLLRMDERLAVKSQSA